MQFGRAFPRLVQNLLAADPHFGPVFALKTNMSDAYMHIWVRLQDILRLDFLAPSIPSDNDPLVCFHLSVPMGYINSSPYFCCSTKTVADIVNALWEARHDAGPHPLKAMDNTLLPDDSKAATGLLSTEDEDYVQARF